MAHQKERLSRMAIPSIAVSGAGLPELVAAVTKRGEESISYS